MSAVKFPPCPPQLKSVQHYLKLASDYESRNIVITYWARLYALQTAIKIDKKSPDARSLLTAIMDWMETCKKDNSENEGISNDVAGQAVLENEGHKLFTVADARDRGSMFDKNTVKAFYTAGIIFDVIEVFGELSEEISGQRKYAKWKATYIHNCLKNGETPVPGPIGGDSDETADNPEISENFQDNVPSHPTLPAMPPDQPTMPHFPPSQTPSAIPNLQIPSHPSTAVSPEQAYSQSTGKVSPQAIAKAQKLCKFATSALDYEDTTTAMDYLTKAMNLLATGKET